MKDIELIPINGKFCVTMDTFNQLLDDDNKKKQALEKIATYVTHLLDENMIASKYGKDILDIIMEGINNGIKDYIKIILGYILSGILLILVIGLPILGIIALIKYIF